MVPILVIRVHLGFFNEFVFLESFDIRFCFIRLNEEVLILNISGFFCSQNYKLLLVLLEYFVFDLLARFLYLITEVR